MEGWKRERIVVVLGVGPVPDFRGMADLSALVLERRMSAPSEREVLERINRIASPNPERTFDRAISDLERITDLARLALSHTPEGASGEVNMELRAMALRLAFDDGYRAAGGGNSHQAWTVSECRKRHDRILGIPSNETGEKK